VTPSLWVAGFAFKGEPPEAFNMRAACIAFLAYIVTHTTGCVPHTERAVRQTERISELAQSSGERFGRIARMSRVVKPNMNDIESEAIRGQSEQAEIQHAAAAARRQIVNTQDIRSPWVGILTLWAAVFLAAFIVIALVYLGVAPWARKALNSSRAQ
jgi:hypothetical protein